jgi:hypothetical protein
MGRLNWSVLGEEVRESCCKEVMHKAELGGERRAGLCLGEVPSAEKTADAKAS